MNTKSIPNHPKLGRMVRVSGSKPTPLRGRFRRRKPPKGSRNPKLRKPEVVGRVGRRSVTIYERFTPSGGRGWMVSNWAEGTRRRFDSYPTYEEAKEAARKLVTRLASHEVHAAALTEREAIEYTIAKEKLAPFRVTIEDAANRLVDCLKLVPLDELPGACKAYVEQRQNVTPKRVAEVVEELVKSKKTDGRSQRHIADLRYRLRRFASDHQQDMHRITGPQIQHWLERLSLHPRGYMNFRGALRTLFSFASARGYCQTNPVQRVQTKKSNGGRIEIYTPEELVRLLNAADEKFLPALAIQAFGGLRTAEVQRLTWAEVDLNGGFITVEKNKAKTASRRLVPILPNLKAWLEPVVGKRGRIWKGSAADYTAAQAACAEATKVEGNKRKRIPSQDPVKWVHNGLRHSFISYRLAVIKNVAEVALEAGNSPQQIFSNYRELVRPDEAEQWFSIMPGGDKPANVVPMAKGVAV